MTLEPIFTASLMVQIHLVTALLALCIGPFALWRRRRDRVHKVLGYTWVSAMVITSLVALAIPSSFAGLGLAITPLQFGPIHLLSLYALWGMADAMRAIWRGDVARHEQVMTSVYVRGLALAGALTLLPGRLLHRSLIPETPEIGYAVIAAVASWACAPLFRARRVKGA